LPLPEGPMTIAASPFATLHCGTDRTVRPAYSCRSPSISSTGTYATKKLCIRRQTRMNADNLSTLFTSPFIEVLSAFICVHLRTGFVVV
jgi:hypothetical protein